MIPEYLSMRNLHNLLSASGERTFEGKGGTEEERPGFEAGAGRSARAQRGAGTTGTAGGLSEGREEVAAMGLSQTSASHYTTQGLWSHKWVWPDPQIHDIRVNKFS